MTADDLDAIPWGPPAGDRLPLARAKAHRHNWGQGYRELEIPVVDGMATLPNGYTVKSQAQTVIVPEPIRVLVCSGCGLTRADYEARQRAGRNNRKRGQHYEHEWAARLAMRQTGGLGKEDDAMNEVFVGQAKSMGTARFPGWMAVELDKLRARWADRVPILGILEAAGSGRKGRRLIVVDEADWIALHVGDKAEKVIGWIK